MRVSEKPEESVSATPNLTEWTNRLSDKLNINPDPNMRENLELLLQFVNPTRDEHANFGNERIAKAQAALDHLKSDENTLNNLNSWLSETITDVELKSTLTELKLYMEGTKSLPEAVERPESGGVPVNAPPSSPDETLAADAPETDESPLDTTETTEEDAETAEAAGTQQKTENEEEISKPEESDKDRKARETDEYLRNYRKAVKRMGAGELLAELFKMLKDVFSKFGEKLGLTAAVEKFSSSEAKAAGVDFSRADETQVFSSPNKEVEYVAKVLNLPAKSDSNAFLTALKNTPGYVFNADKNISALKTGDVLFFHDGTNKEIASSTAIVSSTDPRPRMKMVDETGKVMETDIQQSNLFINWLGYVKVPEKSDQTAEPKSPAEESEAITTEDQSASETAPTQTVPEPYKAGTKIPVISDTPVLQNRISDIYANNPHTYTTANMPEKLGRTKPEIEPYLTNMDPVTGRELTFLGKPFNKPPAGGVNLMMIPFLKAAEEKIKQANLNYKPKIERYRGYEFRGLKINGVPSEDILSSHAFGMAFDIDPGTNMPKNGRGDIPDQVIMALVESGFAWGSVRAEGFYFGGADAMHFQLRFDPRDAQGQAIINSSPAARLYWEKISPQLNDIDQRVRGTRQA